MEFTFAIAAGMLVREITQIIIEQCGWEQRRPLQVITSIVITAAVGGLFSLLPMIEFSEAWLAQIWAVAFSVHLVKGLRTAAAVR